MNGDTAVELGDGVIMSFVEVCLFFLSFEAKWLEMDRHTCTLSSFFFFFKDAESPDNGWGWQRCFSDCIHSVSYANNIFQCGHRANTFHSHESDPRGCCGFPRFIPGLSERADLTGNLGQLFSGLLLPGFHSLALWSLLIFHHPVLEGPTEPPAPEWTRISHHPAPPGNICVLYRHLLCSVHTLYYSQSVQRGSELAGTGSCQLPTMVDERQSHHLGSQVSLTLHCVNMIMILQEAKC